MNPRTLLSLLVLPLLFVGAGLLPGRSFLPQAPAMFEPLASEDPGRAALAALDANLLASDRLFPSLTDELAIAADVRAGIAPTWAPELAAGMPLAAGTITGAWYPPRVLRYLIHPARASAWLAVLTLFLAGLGVQLFLARRGLSWGASIVGALCAQSSSFAIAHLHYPMKVDAALWSAWAWWAILGLRQGRPWSGFALAVSIGLSFLAGFVPIAIFVTTGALAFAVLASFESTGTTTRPRFLARVVAWTVLGVSLAGVQWWPMRAASLDAMRGPQSAAAIEGQRLPLVALGTLIVPDLFGTAQDPQSGPRNPVAWQLARASERELAENANALEWNVSFGLGALILTAAALVQPRRSWIPLVLSLGAFLFAFGAPFADLVYGVPGFDFGAPGRALFVAWIATAWLAAEGFEALSNGERRARRSANACAAAVLVIGLGLAFTPLAVKIGLSEDVAARFGATLADLAQRVTPEEAARAEARLHVAGLSVAALALLALLATLGLLARRKRVQLGLWCAIAGVQGFALAHEHLASRKIAPDQLFPPSPAIEAIRRAAGDGRVVRVDRSASGIDDVLELARPNLLAGYGIDDLTPYVLFQPRRLVELVLRIDPKSRYRTGVSRLSHASLVNHRVLDLLRVSCVLSREPLENPRLELVHQRAGFFVYHRTGALPLVRVVPAELVLVAGDVAVLGLLAAGGLDPAHIAIADSTASIPVARSTAPFTPGELLVHRAASDRIDVEVRGSSGGWLVFDEEFDPGWKAAIDGADADFVRVDHVCRALAIPPGDCTVRTKYEPETLREGAWMTLGALLLALGLTVFPMYAAARRANAS